MWKVRFFDDFDDASVGVQQDPQNGTITEPAGTELVLSCSAGTLCRWDSAGQDRPCGYEEIATHASGKGVLMRFEAKVSSFVQTGHEVLAGLCLWGPTRKDAYVAGWYNSNNDMYFQRMLDGTFTTRWNAEAGENNPNTTPHIHRMYLNTTGDRAIMSEVAKWIEPGEIAFVYSVNNGSTWQYGYKETLAFAPTRFGAYSRNWSGGGYRGFTAGFDWLKFEENTDPEFTLSDGESGDNKRPDVTQPGAAIEGDATVRSESVEAHKEDLEPDAAAIEIEAALRDAGGDSEDGLERGVLKDEPANAGIIEEFQVSQVIDADYLIEKQDGDGNDLLAGLEVRGIEVIDTTAGSFGTTSGHYGAAKNGKFYWNGVECGPGDFGTLGTPRRTAWPYWKGASQPFATAAPAGMSITVPADDVVQMQGTSIDVWEAVVISSRYGWMFPGDFDIQVDYSDYSDSGGSDGGPSFEAWINNNNKFYVRRRINAGVAENGRYDKDVRINGSWGNYAFVNANGDTSGKLRLVRSGSVVSSYYWTGSAWAQIGTSTDMGSTDPMFVGLVLSATGNANVDIKWSNLTINSGSTTNRAKWYQEASGTHRGTQQDMPDDLLAITTKTTLELVDRTNNKLWMRFVQGTNNVILTESTSQPRRTRWNNGLLLVAYGSGPNDTQGGGAIWIDFTMDRVRIHRESVSTITGGYYWSVAAGFGVIADRNSARGWATDDNDWQIQDYRVFDVDIYRDSGDEFRAVATLEGMTMFKQPRWELTDLNLAEYSISNETGHMRWCLLDQSDGELFYMTDSDMYSRDKTGAGQGWEDWMTGGTWTAQFTKSLPGNRTFEAQLHPVRLSNILFLPANEGVYRVDWPSGSWTLFFGKTLSGATHEILPLYDYISAVQVANDGTNDLLLVSVVRGHRGQVVAIKLSDNSIYARAKVVDLKVPSVMEA